jgi:hypothetical protein
MFRVQVRIEFYFYDFPVNLNEIISVFYMKKIVKFCEHSKSITSSVTFNDNEKCSKLCEMKKVLHHHRVPCSMMPDKLDLQPTFQPLENFLIFSAEKAPESVHLHNDINKLQQEAMKHHRNKLCLNLCRRGNGGNLCKCDLAPF